MKKRAEGVRVATQKKLIVQSAKLIRDSKAMIAYSRQIILDSQVKRNTGY